MGGKIIDQLVDRRIREAKMFLYGDYDGSDPHEYRYIEYDAGAGEVESSMIFYEYGKPYGQLQTAERSGYTTFGLGHKLGNGNKRLYRCQPESICLCRLGSKGL